MKIDSILTGRIDFDRAFAFGFQANHVSVIAHFYEGMTLKQTADSLRALADSVETMNKDMPRDGQVSNQEQIADFML